MLPAATLKVKFDLHHHILVIPLYTKALIFRIFYDTLIDKERIDDGQQIKKVLHPQA